MSTAQASGPLSSSQLLVSFVSQNRNNAVTKKHMLHWITDAINLSYEVHGLASTLGLHQECGIFQSSCEGWASYDVCVVAGWYQKRLSSGSTVWIWIQPQDPQSFRVDPSPVYAYKQPCGQALFL